MFAQDIIDIDTRLEANARQLEIFGQSTTDFFSTFLSSRYQEMSVTENESPGLFIERGRSQSILDQIFDDYALAWDRLSRMQIINVKIPSLEEIIKINHRHIFQSGGEFLGSDNIINRGSLEWVLEAIQYPLFGVDHYPALEQKAALLAWTIIKNHVFYDGNKRTAMTSLLYVIRLNQYKVIATSDDIVEIAVRIAGADANEFAFQEFVSWVGEIVIPEQVLATHPDFLFLYFPMI